MNCDNPIYCVELIDPLGTDTGSAHKVLNDLVKVLGPDDIAAREIVNYLKMGRFALEMNYVFTEDREYIEFTPMAACNASDTDEVGQGTCEEVLVYAAPLVVTAMYDHTAHTYQSVRFHLNHGRRQVQFYIDDKLMFHPTALIQRLVW